LFGGVLGDGAAGPRRGGAWLSTIGVSANLHAPTADCGPYAFAAARRAARRITAGRLPQRGTHRRPA
jgi:hypothetical protein